MRKKTILSLFADKLLVLLSTMSVWRRISERVMKSAFESTIAINHNGIIIKFCTPNGWARVRAETFSVKEPETLEWIDSFSSGTVLWDIGGNLGLYSLYTALRDNSAKVFTFEPSIFNLEIMTRNVVLNRVKEQITVMPLALSETSGTDTMHMSMTAWGGDEHLWAKLWARW